MKVIEKIKESDPPHGIRQLCEEAFDLHGLKPIWTFGDTIYNPHKALISRALLMHESVHCEQQGDEPVQWWYDYLHDSEFRFEQELEAYQMQFAEYRKLIKDRNTLTRQLARIAGDLSGEMYGHCTSFGEAMRLIKNPVIPTL